VTPLPTQTTQQIDITLLYLYRMAGLGMNHILSLCTVRLLKRSQKLLSPLSKCACGENTSTQRKWKEQTIALEHLQVGLLAANTGQRISPRSDTNSSL
jgi:hypothetical protein